MPVLTGEKTESERFAGAERTFALEALMGDAKALQAGTSHYLGQNFARAFDVTFQSEEGEHEHTYNTSWGVSTRLVGALIMTHGDDDGLVLPPRLAPYQIVIVPIWKDQREHDLVMEVARRVKGVLGRDARVHLDDREHVTPGAKFYEWERRGVPLRIEIGPRDVSNQQLVLVRRQVPEGEERKLTLDEPEAFATVPRMLGEIQSEMLERATRRREERTARGVSDLDEFSARLEESGGFLYTGWCGERECEEAVKEQTKATIRLIPDEEFASEEPPERCVSCGEEAECEVVWAQAY